MRIENIGFIGLGAMGSVMAPLLGKSDYNVFGYDIGSKIEKSTGVSQVQSLNDLKNSEQIACEVIQISVVELTDNRAVHRNITGIFRMRAVNKDITGMHIRVKKTVAKYLSEKMLHPSLCQ